VECAVASNIMGEVREAFAIMDDMNNVQITSTCQSSLLNLFSALMNGFTGFRQRRADPLVTAEPLGSVVLTVAENDKTIDQVVAKLEERGILADATEMTRAEYLYKQGVPGEDGEDGKDGKRGKDGESGKTSVFVLVSIGFFFGVFLLEMISTSQD